MKKGSDFRKADFPIEKIFLDRWSPRAMSGEKISDKELFTLFEAARWAPSSFNEQPWRFVYAKRETQDFKKFLELLTEGNKTWCKNAAVLVCAISKKNFTHNEKPHSTHMFSTGSAYENIALQGSMTNLVIHGMGGFFPEKAKIELEIPDEYEINMMFAVGKPASPDKLPTELQKSESPSSRKLIKELIFEGKFKND